MGITFRPLSLYTPLPAHALDRHGVTPRYGWALGDCRAGTHLPGEEGGRPQRTPSGRTRNPLRPRGNDAA